MIHDGIVIVGLQNSNCSKCSSAEWDVGHLEKYLELQYNFKCTSFKSFYRKYMLAVRISKFAKLTWWEEVLLFKFPDKFVHRQINITPTLTQCMNSKVESDANGWCGHLIFFQGGKGIGAVRILDSSTVRLCAVFFLRLCLLRSAQRRRAFRNPVYRWSRLLTFSLRLEHCSH